MGFSVNLSSRFPKFRSKNKFFNRVCSLKKKEINNAKIFMIEKNRSDENALFSKFCTLISFGITFISLDTANFIKSNLNMKSNAAKFSNKNVHQKLSQIPVFAVTNSGGQPYLTNNSKGDQVGLIFFSYDDALQLLKGMQKNHQVLDARVYIMGLDKAYKMATSTVSQSGYKGVHGQDLKMLFRFYPNKKQVNFANSLIKKKNFMENFKGCPAFIAEGLTIKKGKEEIVPIFLTKEDLESAWSNMCLSNPDLSSKPNIEVLDLLYIINEMHEKNQIFDNYGFFPPEESLEFVNRETKVKPSAKIPSGLIQKF
jgi:hypothetical protein